MDNWHAIQHRCCSVRDGERQCRGNLAIRVGKAKESVEDINRIARPENRHYKLDIIDLTKQMAMSILHHHYRRAICS
jgi:hypothetical protein